MSGLPRPARPRLADALACVTGRTTDDVLVRHARAAQFGERSVALAFDANSPTWTLPLTITDAREAWEALAARGVIPFSAIDDPRREFRAVGLVHGYTYRFERDRGEIVDVLGPDGRVVLSTTDRETIRRAKSTAGPLDLPHPATIAACVALAADWSGVVTAEALAREVTGCERVVWRVASLAEHASVSEIALRGTFGVPEVISRDAQARLRCELSALGYPLDDVADGVVRLLAPGLDGR